MSDVNEVTDEDATEAVRRWYRNRVIPGPAELNDMRDVLVADRARVAQRQAQALAKNDLDAMLRKAQMVPLDEVDALRIAAGKWLWDLDQRAAAHLIAALDAHRERNRTPFAWMKSAGAIGTAVTSEDVFLLESQAQQAALPDGSSIAPLYLHAAPRTSEYERARQDAETRGIGYLMLFSNGHSERVDPDHIALKVAVAPQTSGDN